MHITAVLALFADLPEAELTSWITRGWVLPDPASAAAGSAQWEFHDIDIARVRLIHDLHRAMAIDEATMPLVLSLLDQIYDLREHPARGAAGAGGSTCRSAHCRAGNPAPR